MALWHGHPAPDIPSSYELATTPLLRTGTNGIIFLPTHPTHKNSFCLYLLRMLILSWFVNLEAPRLQCSEAPSRPCRKHRSASAAVQGAVSLGVCCLGTLQPSSLAVLAIQTELREQLDLNRNLVVRSCARSRNRITRTTKRVSVVPWVRMCLILAG